jgi:hypothetical protein
MASRVVLSSIELVHIKLYYSKTLPTLLKQGGMFENYVIISYCILSGCFSTLDTVIYNFNLSSEHMSVNILLSEN